MLRSLAKAGPSSSVATARAPTRAAGARRQAWRVRATAEFASGYQMSAEDVKAALLDSLYGTDRGLTARSEVGLPLVLARPSSRPRSPRDCCEDGPTRKSRGRVLRGPVLRRGCVPQRPAAGAS